MKIKLAFKLIFMLVLIYILSEILLSQEIANDNKSCISSGCHNDMINPKINQNHFIDKCENCHVSENISQHPSKEKGKDFKLLLEEKELCLNCHNKEITVKTKTISNIKTKLNSKFTHSPVESSCIDCHDPHSSKFPHLLKEDFPSSSYGSKFTLCFGCHDDKLLNDKFTLSNTNFRNGDTNLHYIHTYQEKGRSCILCHDIHASNNEKLIKDYSKFGTWKIEISFKSNSNGGQCAPACHLPKNYNLKIENNKPITSNIAKQEIHEVEKIIPNAEFNKQDLAPNVKESDDIFVDEIEINTNRKNNNSEIKNSNIKVESKAPKNKTITIRKNQAKIFDLNSNKKTADTVLNNSVKSYLKSLAKYLKKYPKLKLKVEVIVNQSTPNPEIQLELQKYSNPIIIYMNNNGIATNRIIALAVISKSKNKKQKSISLKVTN